VLVKVGDQKITDINEAVGLMRGEIGTKVTIAVFAREKSKRIGIRIGAERS